MVARRSLRTTQHLVHKEGHRARPGSDQTNPHRHDQLKAAGRAGRSSIHKAESRTSSLHSPQQSTIHPPIPQRHPLNNWQATAAIRPRRQKRQRHTQHHLLLVRHNRQDEGRADLAFQPRCEHHAAPHLVAHASELVCEGSLVYAVYARAPFLSKITPAFMVF